MGCLKSFCCYDTIKKIEKKEETELGKGTEISVPKWDDIEPYVTPDGQICIYPLYAAKARGGVIDEAFNKEAPLQYH